jgi:hypothetical protein
MFRPILLAALLSVACLTAASDARAAAVITLGDVSATSIASGDSFTFAIRMSGADIASYQIPIVISGPTGSVVGTDFDLAPPTAPPAVGYVFSPPPTGNFDATLSTNPGSPTSLFLTITDYTIGDATDGATDLISWITVTTGATFVGAITVDFGDRDDFEILDANFDDAGFQSGAGFLVQVGGPPVVIPEPAAATLLGVGALAVVALARRRRAS